MAMTPHTALEPDSEDTDSGLGESLSFYTDSLQSSLLQSVRENGRGTYCTNQSYFL